MGSMWLDPGDDTEYPQVGPAGNGAFDPQMITGATGFPLNRWGSDFLAMVALHQFVSTNWRARVKLNDPPGAKDQTTLDELEYLTELQWATGPDSRAGRLPEIIAQNTDFQLYMVAQLGISRRSNPQTYLAMKMAARIGELVMVVLKSSSNRARPSQMYPLLFPPLPVAEHSAYPSGHSLVSHLLALTVQEIVPSMGTRPLDLADRISKNREYAGFHFPSDTVAGKEAAFQTFAVMMGLNIFASTVAQATDLEWSSN